MPQVRENRCCYERVEVAAKMGEAPENPDCIINHPGFNNVCLDVNVLQTALNERTRTAMQSTDNVSI